MEEYRAPDFTRDPVPPERPEAHLSYILLALVVMLIFWWGTS